ncbi:hypothetical protein [Ectopseudomonas hydrolytica]|uniref:hypothetical protein n=1 Tax=Ectopseudomonas hydrolytica TaxID=2493633 RepID=UPI00376EE244
MAWLIPALLFAAAVVFWRLSFHTDEYLVAWCRFTLALFLLCIATIYSIGLLAGWVIAQ